MSTKQLATLKQRFGIIGHAPLLHRALEVAMQVAPTDMSVLIAGENGSGKEAIARIIHHLSTYKHGKLITINCGAIPEGTIDSELFGHEKGAFTDATQQRRGYFEEAHQGTIFLDEIAEMPLGTQAKLLRVLEQGTFMRVGSSQENRTHVRVLAATHVDLLQAIAKGTFRQDLYYRLNTVPLRLPPLRKRGEDIMLLFKKFALDLADRYHSTPLKLTPTAVAKLLAYPFPGNVRQLKNLVAQIAIMESSPLIDDAKLGRYLVQPLPTLPALAHNLPQDHFTASERHLLYEVLRNVQTELLRIKALLFEQLRHDRRGRELLQDHATLFHDVAEELQATPPRLVAPSLEEPSTTITPPPITLPAVAEPLATEESFNLEAQEKTTVAKALAQYGHNRNKAAQALGIPVRTLYRKIKAYDL